MFTYNNVNYYPITGYPNEFQVGDGSEHGSALNENNIENIILPSFIMKDNVKHPVTVLAPYCFRGRTKLKSVSLPYSIKVISKDSFWNTSITSLFIPNSVKKIDDYAFSTIPLLKVIIFEKGIDLTSIGVKIFYAYNDTAIHFCSNQDVSNISEIFYGGSTNALIYVLPTYPKGATFGHFPVYRLDTDYCKLSLQRQMTCNNSNNRIQLSLYTYIFILS